MEYGEKWYGYVYGYLHFVIVMFDLVEDMNSES